jgi:maltose O-acetyltransferase
MKTEKEKMLAGELYDALDPRLCDERRRARLLLKVLNDSRADQIEERARLIKELMPATGEGVWIEPPFYCDYGSNITLGDDVFLNFNCVVLDVAPIRIGARGLLGPGVQILAATHPIHAEARRAGLESGSAIEIDDDVWIGGGAIVCAGVTIGARSVIGAGSVVVRDIAADVVAAGNPCRVLRNIQSR